MSHINQYLAEKKTSGCGHLSLWMPLYSHLQQGTNPRRLRPDVSKFLPQVRVVVELKGISKQPNKMEEYMFQTANEFDREMIGVHMSLENRESRDQSASLRD